MHRTIEIALAPEGTEQLLAELAANEHVVGLSIQRGASMSCPTTSWWSSPANPDSL